jgi:hypothetical protein
MVKPQLLSGPAHGPYLVLAHGAGSGMDSPIMTALAGALAGHGIAVARFEFAYMAAWRQGANGRRRRPLPVWRTSIAPFWRSLPLALRPSAASRWAAGWRAASSMA